MRVFWAVVGILLLVAGGMAYISTTRANHAQAVAERARAEAEQARRLAEEAAATAAAKQREARSAPQPPAAPAPVEPPKDVSPPAESVAIPQTEPLSAPPQAAATDPEPAPAEPAKIDIKQEPPPAKPQSEVPPTTPPATEPSAPPPVVITSSIPPTSPPAAPAPIAPAAETPKDLTPIPAKIEKLENGNLKIDDRFIVKGEGTQEKPYEVTWDQLVSVGELYNPRDGKKRLPERVTMLDGKFVKVSGYIAFPLQVDRPKELLSMLNQWDGCCIGVPPTPFDAVEVRLKAPIEGGDRYATQGEVAGKFGVKPYLAGDWLVGLYVMDDASFSTKSTAGSSKN